MQGGIERSVLHLQKLVCASLNVFSDLVAVSRPIEKRPQDEHVKRSLEEPDPLLRLLRYRRHSTLNLAAMVGLRLSVVNDEIALNFRVPGGLSPLGSWPETRFWEACQIGTDKSACGNSSQKAR
jgi:hypothetical protein